MPGEPAEKAAEGYKQGKVDYGHVVKEEFPGGVDELKAWLSLSSVRWGSELDRQVRRESQISGI